MMEEESLRNAGRVLGRASLIGTALYLTLTADPDVNLRLNLLSYAVAVVWSLVDGIYLRGIWWVALVEGFLVHIGCVAVGNILMVVAGSPFS